jgi:copper chaperone CopZ
MKTPVLFAIGLSSSLFILSCGSNEKKIISVEKKVTYTKLAPVHADRKLAIEIEGMSCEHACGGSIRMALKETGAVDRVSYDFKPDRKSNTAYITFDKSKISVDQIVQIIEEVNEKQFKTGKSSSTALESKSAVAESNSDTKTNESTKPAVNMSTTSVEVPSLASFFALLIR